MEGAQHWRLAPWPRALWPRGQPASHQYSAALALPALVHKRPRLLIAPNASTLCLHLSSLYRHSHSPPSPHTADQNGCFPPGHPLDRRCRVRAAQPRTSVPHKAGSSPAAPAVRSSTLRFLTLHAFHPLHSSARFALPAPLHCSCSLPCHDPGTGALRKPLVPPQQAAPCQVVEVLSFGASVLALSCMRFAYASVLLCSRLSSFRSCFGPNRSWHAGPLRPLRRPPPPATPATPPPAATPPPPPLPPPPALAEIMASNGAPEIINGRPGKQKAPPAPACHPCCTTAVTLGIM